MRNVLGAVLAVSAVIPVGGASTVHGSTTDLLVGDSVMAGMGSTARARLSNHVFDAKVCRRLTATGCSYQGVRPSTALGVVQAWRGTTNRAIVVGAGYNDGSIGSAVDSIVREARRQGVPHVVWLTYRVAGSNAALYRSHNGVLRQKAEQFPELRIADWASVSAGRSDFVASDGLHLNGSGALAMADLVASVLAGLQPAPPPGPPPLAPSARLCFPVAGSPGDVALVNLTPVEAVGPGNGQLISSDVATPPLASNVNFGPGTIDPNVAAAPIGADGKVCFANSEHTTVHLIADHLGSIKSTAYQLATGTGAPDRKIDTRNSG